MVRKLMWFKKNDLKIIENFPSKRVSVLNTLSYRQFYKIGHDNETIRGNKKLNDNYWSPVFFVLFLYKSST